MKDCPNSDLNVALVAANSILSRTEALSSAKLKKFRFFAIFAEKPDQNPIMAGLKAKEEEARLVGVHTLGQTLLPVFAPILGRRQLVVDAEAFWKCFLTSFVNPRANHC